MLDSPLIPISFDKILWRIVGGFCESSLSSALIYKRKRINGKISIYLLIAVDKIGKRWVCLLNSNFEPDSLSKWIASVGIRIIALFN